MKLSYNWLKEYVDGAPGPEELAEGLTMSGSEVETIRDLDGDKIMNLEITSNRPDCLNIIGLAREASAIFDRDLRVPDMKLSEKTQEADGPTVKCIIKNKQLCPYYTARVMAGVRVKETGEKINKRIRVLDMRPVNNVVDVTNFCLIETGQPMHAFDLDRIKGAKVIIREAARNEKIITIDGVERTLEPGMLVIADSDRPIAIAGIMGGKDTEVTENTENILLESAYFDPVSVRRTARSLGLSSDSSYRFERGVDKGMIRAASDRAAELISVETGGRICALYHDGSLSADEVLIKFDVEKAARILGVSLDKEKVKRIFNRLGMRCTAKDGVLSVKVPSFREDLKREVDLVEEVARIYGYDKIPETITKFVPQVRRKERPRLVEEKLRATLASSGLNEVMTHSLISEKAAERFSELSERTVELQNPLSEEQKVLTPQLLDGMLRVISWNINRKNADLALFELGKIYTRIAGEKRFDEMPTLCVGLTGYSRKDWREGARPVDLYDLKGLLEEALRRMRVNTAFSAAACGVLMNCAAISVSGEKDAIGFLGEVKNDILNEYAISQPVCICQVKLGSVIKKAVLEDRYKPVPRFPAATRDISILCDQTLDAGDIREEIARTEKKLIRDIELVDIYEGEQIPAGKKGLTYSINYALEDRTLTEEEVESTHSRIKEALTGKFDISFR